MRTLLLFFSILTCMPAFAARSVMTENGCQYFDETSPGTMKKTSVKWQGSCPKGKADGAGYIQYNGDTSDAIYYREYYELKNGVFTNPYFGFASVEAATGRVILKEFYKTPETQISPEACAKIPQCKRVLTAVNGGKASASSSNKSESQGALGPVTPAPLAMLRNFEGSTVACTDAAIGAAGNKIINQLSSEINAEGMCPPAKGVAKAIYFSITTIEKSCTPAQIPQIADMEQLRAQLKEAVDIINFSCSP